MSGLRVFSKTHSLVAAHCEIAILQASDPLPEPSTLAKNRCYVSSERLPKQADTLPDVAGTSRLRSWTGDVAMLARKARSIETLNELEMSELQMSELETSARYIYIYLYVQGSFYM